MKMDSAVCRAVSFSGSLAVPDYLTGPWIMRVVVSVDGEKK